MKNGGGDYGPAAGGDAGHEHGHAPGARLFEFRGIDRKKLLLSFTITVVVMAVELAGGIATRSIALVSDAGHMFTHAFAIAISLVAISFARRAPCHHRTFGLYRAEILAAFINGLFLLGVVGLIVYESVRRIIEPHDILARDMLIIALVGLIVNVASMAILHGSHRRNINIKGVFYHLVADAASSVGIVFAAVLIYYTGWNIVDPVVSIGISLVIVFWAVGILRESGKILLEMAPASMNVEVIINDLKGRFPEIKKLEHAHLWTITSDMLVFSAHIRLDDTHESARGQNRLISDIGCYLCEKYHIMESTIQILSEGDAGTCPLIPGPDGQ